MGCAVEIAGRVFHQASDGIGAIDPAFEAVEHRLVAGAVDFVYGSARVFAAGRVATELGCAINIALRVADDGARNRAVRPSGECVQDSIGLRLRRSGGNCQPEKGEQSDCTSVVNVEGTLPSKHDGPPGSNVYETLSAC